MTRRTVAFIGILPLLAGCETTGDPNAGGLFGWSETRARERIVERQAALAGESQALADEQTAGSRLSRRERENAAEIENRTREANALRERRATQNARLAALETEVDRLEADSPTPSRASYARRLRRDIERFKEDETLTLEERDRGLAKLQQAIERARSKIGVP